MKRGLPPGHGLPVGTAPTWQNWTGNLVHQSSILGLPYYFSPQGPDALRAVIAHAAELGLPLRVSGQRHSQPPLVVEDNRGDVPTAPTTVLVDMSCYADLGPDHTERMVLLGEDRVQVCPGVRLDELDAFLTNHDLMLRTVTAGGYFSIGGIVTVDVNGATLSAPIFAETAIAITLMLADGSILTVDADSPRQGDWSMLQLARVSLGTLGVVTSITLEVLPRPYATTLAMGTTSCAAPDRAAFIGSMRELVTKHDRLETLVNPYVDLTGGDRVLALWWDVDTDPEQQLPNSAPTPDSACSLASRGLHGSTSPGPARVARSLAKGVAAQDDPSPLPAAKIFAEDLKGIAQLVEELATGHPALWISGPTAGVLAMAYSIPLPDLDEAGLGKLWDALEVVGRLVRPEGSWHVAAPIDIRFIRAGDSALSSSWSEAPGGHFANIDLIAHVAASRAEAWPDRVLAFMAAVEREWVAMGGFPHSGKIFGFYDPAEPEGTFSPPLNPGYLRELRARRGERVEAFEACRARLDPEGRFLTPYLARLLGSPGPDEAA